MRCSYDSLGFPLLAVQEAAVEVHLLPITKLQCEPFLADNGNAYADRWYETVLATNPRVSMRRFTSDQRERLFLTGITPPECMAYAGWLGEHFTLPTVREWRLIYNALERQSIEPVLMRHLLGGSDVSRICIQRLCDFVQPRTLLDLSLMRGGVVEWVQQSGAWLGLGAPRAEFYPNLWDPSADEIKPLRTDVRLPYFGFRLVRRSA